jgi:hypothetical protein
MPRNLNEIVVHEFGFSMHSHRTLFQNYGLAAWRLFICLLVRISFHGETHKRDEIPYVTQIYKVNNYRLRFT